MKLSKHIFTKYFFSESFRFEIIANFLKQNPHIRTKDEKLDVVNLMIKDIDTCRKYVISKTIYQSLNRLKISKPNWTIFNHLPNEKNVYLLNERSFVIIHKIDNKLRMYIMTIEKTDDPTKEYLKFDVIWKDTLSGESSEIDVKSDFELLLFQLMCFVHLTENEEVTIFSRVKYGSKRDPENRIFNDTPFPVTIVNSMWHKTVIRTEGFEVKGHYRLQPYGPGRTKTKLILIPPFEKKGYTRTYGEA